MESYRKLGRFIGCYSTVKGLWNTIEGSLKDRGAEKILQSLQGKLFKEQPGAKWFLFMVLQDSLNCAHMPGIGKSGWFYFPPQNI